MFTSWLKTHCANIKLNPFQNERKLQWVFWFRETKRNSFYLYRRTIGARWIVIILISYSSVGSLQSHWKNSEKDKAWKTSVSMNRLIFKWAIATVGQNPLLCLARMDLGNKQRPDLYESSLQPPLPNFRYYSRSRRKLMPHTDISPTWKVMKIRFIIISISFFKQHALIAILQQFYWKWWIILLFSTRSLLELSDTWGAANAKLQQIFTFAQICMHLCRFWCWSPI
jgi:hypothetical protein